MIPYIWVAGVIIGLTVMMVCVDRFQRVQSADEQSINLRSSIFSSITSRSISGRTAIAILAKAYDAELAVRVQKISQHMPNASVFLFLDGHEYSSYQMVGNNVTLVHIDAKEAKSHGFQKSSTVTIPKAVVSWDKALYFFTTYAMTQFDFIWLIEDDVYIPNMAENINALTHTSKERGADLVVSFDRINTDGRQDWFWSVAVGYFDLTWHESMVCATGMSRRMLTAIKSFVDAHKKLLFVELFFSTLAAKNNLTIYNPPQLAETIQYRHHWTCADVKKQPGNWFHPVKNITALLETC